MGNDLKGYDAFQVLRSVFDVDKNCLRVCVVDGTTGSGPGFEVIITHTEDSIRLGDGTNLFTGTTIGSKTGLDINLLDPPTATVGDTDTLVLGAAGSEGSFPFPVGTKWFEFRSRNRGRIDFGYASADRNFRVMPGEIKRVSDLKLGSVTNVYFSSTKNADTIEIHYWV